MAKPSTTVLVNHNIRPFTIKVNNPNVTILIGSVNSITTGLIMALIIPRVIDPKIAPNKVTSKPLITYAARIIPAILRNHLSNHPLDISGLLLNVSLPKNTTLLLLFISYYKLKRDTIKRSDHKQKQVNFPGNKLLTLPQPGFSI
jgi:hypothetical protein